MIAVDTSSFLAYLSGAEGLDVETVEAALADGQVCLPPVVLTELLSARDLSKEVASLFRQLPLLSVAKGYWDRAGLLRSRVLSTGCKARLADALIAQSCLDHKVRLVSRDRDFRHFAAAGGLKLLAP